MNKCIVEVLGTFFVTLVACLVALQPHQEWGALAIGLTLMAMVYAGGHISGGHYNPAISVAALARGSLRLRHVGFYAIAQLLGAAFAVVVAPLLVFSQQVSSGESADLLPMLVSEGIFSLGLSFVVFNVASTAVTAGNSFYGLAIGLIVTVGLLVSPISGGALNPAITLAMVFFNSIGFLHGLLLIGAQLLGAVVGAYCFRAVYQSGSGPLE
jgi:aquaporin Z